MAQEKRKIGLLSDLILSRSNFVELVIVGVLLALFINLIAGSLPVTLGCEPGTILYLSVGCTLLLLAYLSIRFFGGRQSSKSYSGFFTVSRKENKVIGTERWGCPRHSGDLVS